MSETTPASVELSAAYVRAGFDALVPTDLLADEVAQRRESGYDVDDVVLAANSTDPADRDAVLALVDAMEDAPRRADWAYDEPEGLDGIRAEINAELERELGARPRP